MGLVSHTDTFVSARHEGGGAGAVEAELFAVSRTPNVTGKSV